MVLALALSFRTPLGALACLAALVPLAALAVSRRRSARAARALGLPAESGRPKRALVVAGACLAFGLAASQPVWSTGAREAVRTDVEAFFVVDVSRSMLASLSAGSPTRLDRARAAALELRSRIPEVPAGLAGFTDRTLPYLFPTRDSRVFASTLETSVAPESPPPQEVSRVASGFDALAAVATRDFFRAGLDRRLCVVLTDGESRPFSAATIGAALGSQRGCRLVIVRFGRGEERVFGLDGRPEPQYRPDDAAASLVAQLADAAGGEAFDEGQLGAAGDALAASAGSGPTRSPRGSDDTIPLAVYAALAGFALVLWSLVGPAAARWSSSNLARRVRIGG
jgi:hypothetical protein